MSAFGGMYKVTVRFTVWCRHRHVIFNKLGATALARSIEGWNQQAHGGAARKRAETPTRQAVAEGLRVLFGIFITHVLASFSVQDTLELDPIEWKLSRQSVHVMD